MTTEKKDSLASSLKKLENIANWFDQNENIDVEEGIKHVKEGALLIKETKKKLAAIENEFEEIKKSMSE